MFERRLNVVPKIICVRPLSIVVYRSPAIQLTAGKLNHYAASRQPLSRVGGWARKSVCEYEWGHSSCVQYWMTGWRKPEKYAARSCRAMHVCAAAINSPMLGREFSSTRRRKNYHNGQAAHFARRLTSYPANVSLRPCLSPRSLWSAASNDERRAA